MEALTELGHFLMKVGVLGMLVVTFLLYGAYAVESHCWSPMGCKNPEHEAEQQVVDNVLHCWSNNQQSWSSCRR